MKHFLWYISTILLLLKALRFEYVHGIRVDEGVDLNGIFRPHQGFLKKTRMCISCKLFQDLDKEAAANRKEKEKNNIITEMRIGTHTLQNDMARKNRKKMALITGDPMWGQGSRFVVRAHPTTMDVVQDAKDKALKVAASLPKGAREMVLKIVRERWHLSCL